eukprot:CAMPEP_0181094750 /NCGR_PEP_ID=MMETSP1071-20121207/10157_1 /TAXON_ID=35127 /ORGANISM="Thalassiosira sp., Strain NH16" /LENGTH=721 /DNA_ID=CAMNT_0023177095 /DNA_START=54 /DNA_END=2219 /DNA_ORIENTATION=+
MKSSNALLAVFATVLMTSCHARTLPLASTATSSGTVATSNRSNQSDDGAVDANDISKTKGKDRKLSLRIPRWGQGSGRRSGGNKSDSGDGGNDTTPEKSKAADNSDNKLPADMEKEEGIADEEATQSSSESKDATDTTESAEKEEPSQPESTDDGKTEAGQHHSGPQATNQTRPGIVYMNIAPPTAPMVPHHHARPMQYQYIPQHQQQPPPPAHSTPPSLLSSILSMFLPRPQNMPPSPFGPPMPPSSPNGPNNAITSLVLRLALVSLGTLVLDLFGFGSHSDAYLPTPSQHYTFERVNDRYRRDGSALRQALESPPPGVRHRRWKHVFGRRKRDAVGALLLTEESNGTDSSSLDQPPSLGNGALYNRTVIIVDMKPDSKVGNGMAEYLRDTVSFLIEQHRDHVDKRNNANGIGYSSKLRLPSKLLPPYFSKASSLSSSSRNQLRTARGIRPALGNELEIVLFLDSGGGTVQDYGLASSHLSRLRDEPHVTLSVCVDRVAASGGYMMACQATPGHLYAAPFAMLGSIGVLMETVNVHEVLKRYGVKPLVIKAGKNKAPLKTFGEVTTDELKMAQDDADVIHTAFQEWVTKSRPGVVASKDWIEKVCTGAVFLGNEARELGLVDRVLTSDEYVAERIAAGDRVLRLMPYRGPQFGGLKISPLDLLLSGMDAKGRAKIRERIRGLGTGVLRSVAPLFRVGAAVGVLNHFATLQNQSQGYYWSA